MGVCQVQPGKYFPGKRMGVLPRRRLGRFQKTRGKKWHPGKSLAIFPADLPEIDCHGSTWQNSFARRCPGKFPKWTSGSGRPPPQEKGLWKPVSQGIPWDRRHRQKPSPVITRRCPRRCLPRKPLGKPAYPSKHLAKRAHPSWTLPKTLI